MHTTLWRLGRMIFVLVVIVIGTLYLQATLSPIQRPIRQPSPTQASSATDALTQLTIKGRAPKTGYSRELFSTGWGTLDGCDLRNYILARDMTDVTYIEQTCMVKTATLADPYTNTTVSFTRGNDTSNNVQIDHVVSLSDAWQKGAQQLTPENRFKLANDPLNLLAVNGSANQQKGDGDAATWLPPNKQYRCSYVARQIAVKTKYNLWVTEPEYRAMAKILATCPEQDIPQTQSSP